jgi:glycerol-3-phosphate acyltransferase PlsX
MRIAVDAMGGDYAPEAIVEGTVQAAEAYGHHLILVGQGDRIRQELDKYPIEHLSIEVKHASQIVDMHDLPSFALRRKKDSSLHVAINMVKHGEADAAVSAGNTGAAMAIGKLACRMLEGIDRPALAVGLPNINGITVLIDIGANVDCKPIHLLQFAVMGHLYAKEVHGVQDPRIGLLSVGEEETKGNVLTKEVFEPLSQSTLNFIGNAEGRDVYNGRVDVVVCDGFTGNVVLKVSESLAKAIGTLLREGFSRNWRTKLAYVLFKPEMDRIKRRIDHKEYGGAPLLGLNGVVIVSHGSSKARSIKNAIRAAAESVEHHLNDHIIEMMQECEFDTKSRARATSLWSQIKRSITPHDSSKEKNRPEKKEETQPSSSSEEFPEETKSDKPEKKPAKPHESEKKPWWHLKSRESEKEEPSSAQEEELPQPPHIETESELLKQPEDTLLPHETDKTESPKPEKKPWWQLTHREKHHEESALEAHQETHSIKGTEEKEENVAQLKPSLEESQQAEGLEITQAKESLQVQEPISEDKKQDKTRKKKKK